MVSVLSVRVAVAASCLPETSRLWGGRVPKGRGLSDENLTKTAREGGGGGNEQG